MTPADRKAFARDVMGRLHAAFGWEDEVRTELKAEVYFEALQEFGLDEIRAATRELTRTHTYGFPRPAEIIEAIRHSRRAIRAAKAPLALAEPEFSREEATGFLRTLVGRVTAIMASPRGRELSRPRASRRALDELQAEHARLQAVPPDPEHERRKAEALARARSAGAI